MSSDTRSAANLPRMGPGTILAWTVLIGLVAGTLELAIFWLKCHFFDPRNLNVSRQFIWMFPVAGLMIVAIPGTILALLSRFWTLPGRPIYVLFALFLPAYVGLMFRAPVYTSVCVLLGLGLAGQSASWLASRELGLRRWVRLGVVVAAGLLGLTAGGSIFREDWIQRRAGASGPNPVINSKNVILIVLDTVRAESLSLYGYGRETTPQLAKLASRGARFDRAFSTAPWTAPSHASLFTGRWPHELSIGWDGPLDDKFPTLAEELRLRGYETAGFVANTTYCSYETGLARGFQHYEDYDVTLLGIFLCSSVVERTFNFLHKHPELARLLGDDSASSGDRKDAARINRDFLGWLDGRSSHQSFFAFLNYYDAHHPYLSPERETGQELGRKPQSAQDFRLLKTWWERDKQGIKPDDLALARDSYDQCIAYLDEQLGHLFDDLDKRGLIDDSIVIVTADHGEQIGEHDLFGHGCSVYRPELHVPLIMVAPGLLPKGRVITEPVSLRDIPTTVQELTGLAENSVFPGRSLTGLIDGLQSSRLVRSELTSPPEDDPNRGRSPASKGAMTSIISRDHHYIKGGDGREALFDLNRDPAELNDLSRRPEQAANLRMFRDQAQK